MGISMFPRTAVSIAATGTTFDTTVAKYEGVITRYILEVPNYTNDVTTTLSIIDANSVTIFAGAAHAKNANYSIPVDVEVDGSQTYTLRLTLSGAAGGTGGTAYITLYLR
jgi:hypothetical protein